MIQEPYATDFEELWTLYPKWPVGRSKKKPSSDAFERARKVLKFTPADIAHIKSDIEARLKTCVTWQPGNRFGPVMFETYCNQRLWNEPYEKVKRQGWERPIPGPEQRPPPTEAEIERGRMTLSSVVSDLERLH